MQIDFGRTSADYARHRRGFPPQLFDALVELGLLADAPRALDLGCGTGALALELAALGAETTALDPSSALLDELRSAAAARGLSVTTREATAEATGLPAGHYDLVSAGQCWHWFDPVRVCAELDRLLSAEGHVVLASYDWLPLEGSLVEATEQLILAHNPAWHMGGQDGTHPEWERDLIAGGFEVLQVHYERCDAMYTAEAWRGRIRASAGIAASLSAEQVEAFDRQLAERLPERASGEPIPFPHRFGYCVARRRAD